MDRSRNVCEWWKKVVSIIECTFNIVEQNIQTIHLYMIVRICTRVRSVHFQKYFLKSYSVILLKIIHK